METIESITNVYGSQMDPYEDAQELPPELRHSLSSITSKELVLKRRYDSIKKKKDKYGHSRPGGSYMDPKVSDIHIVLNSLEVYASGKKGKK